MENKGLIALITNHDDDVYCFRLELIQAILADGYRLLISCPDGPKFIIMEKLGLRQNKEFIYDNAVIDRRGTNVFNDSQLFLHYLRLLKRHKPSVLLTYTAKPNVYASYAAKLLNIPVINNVTGFGSVLKMRGIKQKIAMLLLKFAYRNSACIMFQNKANMELAKSLGMVKGKYELLPGSGVNTERYPLQDYPEGGNGVLGEKIIFNYVGRVISEKGVDDYIEAAKCIKRKYPNTEFNIIGFIEPTESHYEKDLKELEKQNIVFYRGSQSDIKPWLVRSHCMIHPSKYGEGISNVLLENASSGRPAITTDNVGCKETIEDEVTGFIYQRENINQLINKIELFLEMNNEKRKKIGLLARKFICQNFSRNVVVDEYLKQIKQLIKKDSNEEI